MRRRDFFAWAGASAAALSACARRSAEQDAPLELIAQSEAITLDPRYSADVYGLRIARLVHATLTAPGPETLAPTGWLAESIDDEDGGAIVVTLRKDARFHDNSRVTAGDVVATWRALGDEALGAPARRMIQELARYDAIDGDAGRRVRFVPNQPRAVLRGDLDVPILKASEARAPRGAPLTGSGPYAIVDVRAGAVSLSIAPAYGAWDASAKHAIVVRTVRDESARALRILAGGADIAANVLAPPLALSLPTQPDAPAGLVAMHRAAPTTTYLTFNTERPPLDRPDVRQAIACAIDRAAIVAAKLSGAAQVARSMTPQVIELAPRVTPPWPFDAAAARAVLAPLGAAGATLTLDVVAQRGRVGIARAIAQMIGDAGLPTEVRSLELGTLLPRLGAGDFDVALQTAIEVNDPEVLRWYLHSSAIAPHGANRARVRDPQIDALLDRGLATLVAEERRSIYEELEARIYALTPVAPLWHEDHVAVVGARARGFVPTADGRWGGVARVG